MLDLSGMPFVRKPYLTSREGLFLSHVELADGREVMLARNIAGEFLLVWANQLAALNIEGSLAAAVLFQAEEEKSG